ncbi:MAG TPA: hypothetical protein VK750_01125 [Cytophagaceae bacterium]|jgi:hypothetical protein|nr:hypothetical protein [Cytophagaceae bacterium]
MPKSISDLKDIVRLGGGISVDATKIGIVDLRDLVRIASGSGATIIFRNSGDKVISDLRDLARLAPGKVIFEI